MNQTNFWNDAAKYGAVIGGASAVCSLLGDATGAGFFGLIGLVLAALAQPRQRFDNNTEE